MAKKDKAEQMATEAESLNADGDESTSLATTDSNSEAIVPADHSTTGLALDGMSDKEQLASLEELLDCSASEIEAIATGSLPFWPAIQGQLAVGVIVGQREVPTRFGSVRLYTMTLTKPALGQTLDGEVFELSPGEQISILERTVLKELAMREGQKVAILNVGKKKGGGKFSYWNYKIVGVQRSSAQIQAAAQMAMARMQSRALPAATSKG